MKQVRYSLFTMLIVLGMLLAACGPTPAPTPMAAPTQASAPTTAAQPTTAPVSGAPSIAGSKLAVVLTGPHDDNSWNEAAWNAKDALAAKGVEVAASESIAEGDVARVLREYADQGFQMIVAHSFGYQDGVFEVAGEYPDVNFAWAGGIQRTAKNVADYDQPFYEAAYPIGIIAGYMSKTGKLGAVYGFDIPVCHSMGEAFLLGAQSVNPNAQLIVTASGEWVDVAKNKEAALAQADAGVDFWIECGEGSSLGTIEAAKERGGYATGYVGDMTENGPDVVLVNLVWNLEPLFTKMLEDTLAGTFDNPWYVPGVAEGAMLYTYNDALKGQIPAEAIQAADKAFQDIKDGTFQVPYIPEALP
jgi:basic membrane protein A